MKLKDKMFLGVDTVEEANGIDMTKYRFERYSDTLKQFIFVKRQGK